MKLLVLMLLIALGAGGCAMPAGSATSSKAIVAVVTGNVELVMTSPEISGAREFITELDIIEPSEYAGTKIEVSSWAPLSSDHLFRNTGGYVEFTVVNFDRHRGFSTNGGAPESHVEYFFWLNEIQKLAERTQPNKAPEPTRGTGASLFFLGRVPRVVHL